MAVDLWSTESKIYAEIDKAGVNGLNSLRKRFPLGKGHNVDVNVKDFSGCLSNQKNVSPDQLEVDINFRSGTEPYYRLDFHKNPSDTYLHEHFASGAQTMRDHIPLSGTPSISECVSTAFEKAKEIIPWRFSGTDIAPGTDFSGHL